MKKILYLLTSIFIIGSACATVLLFTNDLNNKEILGAEKAHADWPDKDIKELSAEAELIAVVQSGNLKQKKLKPHQEKSPLEIQLTELKVKKVIKGTTPKTITLDQALNYVEKNTKYLMFLKKGATGNYYELTDKSIIKANNNGFTSNIEGFKGTFSTKQFKEEIQSHLEKQ